MTSFILLTKCKMINRTYLLLALLALLRIGLSRRIFLSVFVSNENVVFQERQFEMIHVIPKTAILSN